MLIKINPQSFSLHTNRFKLIIRIQTVRHLTTHQLNSNSPQSPNVEDLSHALQEMSMRGLDMRFKDYNALLNECVNQKSLIGGQRVQAHMIKTRYLPPLYLRTRLIVLYVKCEVLSDARLVFDQIPQRNVVCYTAIISGYARSGFYSEALGLFFQMLRSGTEPNEFTFATVLTCCTGASIFELGRQIHSLIVKTSSDSHLFVGSSLLDLYAKAGRIQEARIIFEGLQTSDVVSCAAIVSGYAQLGHDQEALDMFRSLQTRGMAPNYVTYVGLLTALSGLAAFEHGRQVHTHILRSELSSYTILHNSLIDVYSNCGNVAYARRVFDQIPERTVVSWNTMLMGYAKHGMGRSLIDLYRKMREQDTISPDSTSLLTVLSGCSHSGMENTGLELFNEMANGEHGIELGVEHYGCVVDLLGRVGQLEKALKFIEAMPLAPNAAIWSTLLGACRVHRDIDVGRIAGCRLLEIEPENAENYIVLCNLYASSGMWDEVKGLRKLMRERSVTKEPGRSWTK